MSHPTRHRASSTFFTLFDFIIIGAWAATLHKYILQNSRVCVGPFPKLLEVLSQSQAKMHLMILFLMEVKSATAVVAFKTKQSHSVFQRETSLIPTLWGDDCRKIPSLCFLFVCYVSVRVHCKHCSPQWAVIWGPGSTVRMGCRRHCEVAGCALCLPPFMTLTDNYNLKSVRKIK